MKKTVAKALAVAISATMAIPAAPVFASDANDGYYGIVTGEYGCSFFENGSTRTYFYSDDYFSEPGNARNSHLRTMSAAMAVSTFGDGSDANITELLSQTGFSDVTSYGFEAGSAQNVTFGHKEINGGELVAVAIGSDEDDPVVWTSDFTLGASGDAQGFSEGAKAVYDDYQDYIGATSINPAKLWVSGYSRGGAIADLLGKFLNQNASSLQIAPEDMYIYTFESPLTTTDDVTFDNIHNCIDENDIVTYVVPANWGFTNCGVKEIVNTENKKLIKKKIDLMSMIMDMSSASAENDGTATYGAFFSELFNWVSNDKYLSRETYANVLQDDACALAERILVKSEDEMRDIGDYFDTDFADSILHGENLYILMSALVNLMTDDAALNDQGKRDLKDVLFSVIDEEPSGRVMDGEDIATLKAAASDAIDTISDLAIDDFLGSESRGDDNTLYNQTVTEHGSDKTDNAIGSVASTPEEEQSWYDGYDAGYYDGYDAGSAKSAYDNASGESSDDLYVSGYRYGYYEGYLNAVDYGDVPHTLTRSMTIAENANAFAEVHYPGNQMAGLEKQDSYYTVAPEIGKAGQTAALTGSALGEGNLMIVLMFLLIAVVAVETVALVMMKKKK